MNKKKPITPNCFKNLRRTAHLLRKDKATALIQEAISKICEANKEINLAMEAGAERHKFRTAFANLVHAASELGLEIDQLN